MCRGLQWTYFTCRPPVIQACEGRNVGKLKGRDGRVPKPGNAEAEEGEVPKKE